MKPQSVPTSTLVRWIPLPPQFVKVNTNGSSFGNPGPSGFGGVIRDSLGHWILGFYSSCGFSNNTIVKLYAIYYGLKTIEEASYPQVIYE